MFVNTDFIKNSYDINRIDGDKLRYYQLVLNNKIYNFPSITTILSHMKDSKKVDEIRASLSSETWDYVSDRGLSRGSVMHKYLENFMLGYHNTKDMNKALLFTQTSTPIDDEVVKIYEEKLKFYNLGRELFYNFWHDGWFNDIKHVVFLEMYLFSLDYKFAGTSDYAYINNSNKLVIGDFKSSTKKKTDDDIFKYKTQVSAYMQAFYEMYGVRAHYGEIKIAYDNEIDTFIVPFEDKEKYLDDEFISKSIILNNRFEKLLTK
jgi:hypothetical protein